MTGSRECRSKGFTLLELLVVMVILGLLLGVGTPQLMKMLGGAKSDATELQIESIATALNFYQLDVGSYPSTDEGLMALYRSPPGAAGWDGPYVKKPSQLLDPWGRPYLYRNPSQFNQPFDVYSLGADGEPGGTGENDDKGSWEGT